MIPTRGVNGLWEHLLGEQVVRCRINRAAELAAKIADDHHAARTGRSDQLLQATDSLGQMLQKAARMDDVERYAREVIGEQIHLPSFESRLVEHHDEPWIEIDREHRAGRCDPPS